MPFTVPIVWAPTSFRSDMKVQHRWTRVIISLTRCSMMTSCDEQQEKTVNTASLSLTARGQSTTTDKQSVHTHTHTKQCHMCALSKEREGVEARYRRYAVRAFNTRSHTHTHTFTKTLAHFFRLKSSGRPFPPSSPHPLPQQQTLHVMVTQSERQQPD